MSRPLNKKELIEFSEDKYNSLITKIKNLSNKEVNKHGKNGRSTKDNLAHVYAWQLMMLTWYNEGMANKNPAMPAPGYTWKDSPKLNQEIDKKYKKTPLSKLIKEITKTHKQLIKLMNKHSEEELFTKKKYSWTGSSSLAVYLRLSTYSHYDWALKKIKKTIQ
jgi:hypothetical protein